MTSRPRSWPCADSSSRKSSAAGGVAVDDEVAEPEQHLVLDRAEQLQNVLHGDRAAGRGGELVERRLGVAVGAAAAARDQCERRVGHVDPLAVGDPRAACGRGPASRGRWKTNVWQRERTVGSTFCSSVVQKTKRRWGGGSSISFSSAFQAASVSWCASSRM